MIDGPPRPATVIKGACPHDCPDTCALEVHVRDGIALKVTGAAAHPPTAGVLCTKVARYTERTYHPDRLLYPQRRVGRKGEGRFERIGWDLAIDIIAERLKPLAARNAEQILPYSYAGTMGLVQGDSMSMRFFHKLGASLLDRTICASAGSAGHQVTLGARIGMDMEAVDQAKLIVFWGSNAITSSVHFWARAQQAKRLGATLVAIDPYRSLTAEKCHLHIALLPGTDAALALGLMHVLIRDGLIDRDYVERYTLGFDRLAARAALYGPQRVADLCGIEAAEVEALARLYGTTRPALIRVNYGMQRARGGGMAVRNIACLPALVGAFRDEAGGLLLSTSGHFSVDEAALKRPDLLAGRVPRTVNMSTIGHALLDDRAPPVRALIVYKSNPVAVAPDSQRVVRGFAREDLFTVVLEHFQTDTADYADILLPATTQLEHLDVIKPYGHYYFVANNPAIQALGEAKPNTEIFRLLARAMGFTEACFEESDAALAQTALPAGWDLTDLLQRGWRRVGTPGGARFAEGGFTTPSGKVEFDSASVQSLGLDSLPDYIGPQEDTRGPLSARYPLAMISPPARHFLNSSFVNVKSLRAAEGEPWLDLHPADAAARGVADGGYVRVFNDRGSLELRARVTSRARRGVVVALSVWWKKLARDAKNANELTNGSDLTDLGGAPLFYDCLVQVEAANEAHTLRPVR